jgi:peptide/nickel transport system substrate-binding protein
MARQRARTGMAVALVAIAAVLALGVSTSDARTAQAPTSITIGVPIEPGDLDVQLTSTAVVEPALYNVYDALTRFDRRANAAPALAVSWKNLTRKTWQFNLRRNVRFHNGEPFTPASAAWSINRAAIPTSMNRGYYPFLVRARVVPRQWAIVIETNAPEPSLPSQLVFVSMLPPKYVQEQRDEFLRHPVGTGPYQFVRWSRGQEFVLRAYPRWWGGRPRYQNVTLKLIPDANVRVQALRAGEIDFAMGVSPTAISQLPKWYAPASNTVCVIRLNNQIEPFNDVRARRAANMAIDRARIVNSLFSVRVAQTANGQVVGPASFGYNPRLRDWGYEPAQARTLLSQSGYRNQTITLQSPSGRWTGDREIMLTAANYLREAGFNVQPQIVEFSVWRTRYFAEPRVPAQFVCTGDDGLTGFRPLTNLATPTGPQSAYNNPAIAAEIRRAQSTFDVAKRRTLMQKIWSDLRTDAFAIPIASVRQVNGAQSRASWVVPLDGRVYANDIVIR